MFNILSFIRSKLADGEVLIRRGTNIAGVDPSTLGGLTDSAQTIAGAKTFSSPAVVAVDDDSNADFTEMLTLRHTTSGTPGPGIGAAVMLECEGAAGPVLAGAIAAELTAVTSGSEVGRIDLLPGAGGAPRAGLHVQGVLNGTRGFELITADNSSTPAITVYGGANAGFTLRPQGTGVISLMGGDGSTKLNFSSTGIAFFGGAPVAQPTAITDANAFTLSGTDQVNATNLAAWLNQNTTKLNAVIAALRSLGLIAT